MRTDRLHRVTEARRTEALPGGRTFDEVRHLLQDAVAERFGTDDAMDGPWVRDLTDEWVAYESYTDSGWCTHQVDYTMADDGAVSFTGEPVEVEVRTSYTPEPAEPAPVAEAVHVDGGRVLEAKGTSATGGRIFAVQIVATGTSKNGYRYPADVLEAAAPLYEGAKAFDHHRSVAELQSSTVEGLVGFYRNVESDQHGLKGDLHLLPSASHIAEALDASIDAQAAGLPPVVGISHDVQMVHKPAIEGGRRISEATRIDRVLSADVVADPSAGGRATRVVAGGLGSNPPTTPHEENITMNLKQLLTLLRQAKAEDRAALLQEHAAVVEASGYTADEVSGLIDVTESPEAPGGPAADTSTPVEDAVAEPVLVAESLSTRMLVREAVTAAGLDEALIPDVVEQLGPRFTEASLTRAVAGYRRILEGVEKRGLTPSQPHVSVTEEDLDKKREKVMRTFEGDYQAGYSSVKEMYLDITGQHYKFGNWSNPDLAAAIIRESHQTAAVEGRVSEGVNASTFGVVLGDVMNRRLVAEYALPQLNVWREIVSSIVPVSDFRSQKVVRYGGYGVLPTVAERGPYQPLTTPANEQATYVPAKRGGTEDFTLEAAANDDIRALTQIPTKLGRAAAQTLYRAVFDILATNPTIYDSVALFAAGHGNNTAAGVLNSSNLAAGRRTMRRQAAYGNSVEILGSIPKYLLVPSDLEETAFQLTASAVAIPASGNASNIPNIHQGMVPLVIDYWTDTNDWFIVGDPTSIPTIEVGFLNGQQDPELFVQDSPTVGSMFNSDLVTWKIRHIWGLAVTDFRGFFRGTN